MIRRLLGVAAAASLACLALAVAPPAQAIVDITVVKSGPANAAPGANVAWTITAGLQLCTNSTSIGGSSSGSVNTALISTPCNI